MFDADLIKARQKRRAAERLLGKAKTNKSQLKKQYCGICESFNRLVRRKQKAYYQPSLEFSKGNSRMLYKKINRLLGKDESQLPSHSNPQRLAEDFRDFFDSKIKRIRRSINEELLKFAEDEPTSPVAERMNLRTPSLSQLKPLSEEEVAEIIKKMSNKFSSLDHIPTWLFKTCLPELLRILCFIINESFSI